MDIVTHAMMGTALALPFLPTHPIEASCFILGSVLPDLDAFSRLFGKKTFLRCHQTYSHAVPIIVVIAALGSGVIYFAGWPVPWAAVILALGMLLHSFLDAGNTYGITLWAPFSRRRICWECVFFIDAVTIVATVAALAMLWRMQADFSPWATWCYPAFLLTYGLLRAMIRWRAAGCAPAQTLSLIPSALWPWLFYGYRRDGEIETFQLNALTGAIAQRTTHAVRDADFATALATLPEYHIMQHLSPAYHVVAVQTAADGTRLTCRDLRIRNFGGSFGRIDVLVNAAGEVVESQFNV